MSVQITERTIQSLCGQATSRKGEAYRRTGKVTLTLLETGTERTLYEAAVKDNGNCRVVVDVRTDGEILAECACSSGFSFEKYCKHVAAALHQIRIARRFAGEENESAKEAADGAINEAVDETASKNAGEAADHTAGKAADHTAGEAADHMAGEAADHMAGEAADHMAGEAADHMAGEAADHMAGEAAEGEASPPSGSTRSSFGAAPTAEDSRLINRMLDLFRNQPRPSGGTRTLFETRDRLEAEFIVFPYLSGPRKHLLGIELRVGPDKRYVVPDIREFLLRFEKGERHDFSRHFAYDPARHCFAPGDNAVLARLAEAARNEKLLRAASGALYSGEVGDPRTLPVPPVAWLSLAPRLAEAPRVTVKHGERTYDGLQITDDPLPLKFEFDRADDDPNGFRLDMHGLADIVALEPYGLALSRGRFAKLRPDDTRRIAELQRMLQSAGAERVRIAPQQMEPFLERVVPGLMKLGEVRISRSVSDRIVHFPLEARIYLDRVRERLLVGLEFQYGDIVINPLEDPAARRGESRILMREGERESRILELMDAAAFARTDSGYYMQDEDSEFDFLHQVVPELEKLAKLYATSAVKERLFVGHAPPRLTVRRFGERTDWLEFRFKIDGIPEAEIRAVIRSLADKRKYHRLPNGALLPLQTEELQEIIRFLNEVGLPANEIADSSFRVPFARGLHLLETRDRGGGGTIVRLEQSLRLLLDNLREPDPAAFPVPDSLAPVLRDYQQYGYRWLKTLARYRFGGILADDMGLGKTVQSIAYLVSVLPEIRARKQPALIVAPASLMYNWQYELRRFAPGLRAVVADGSKTERGAVLSAAVAGNADGSADTSADGSGSAGTGANGDAGTGANGGAGTGADRGAGTGANGSAGTGADDPGVDAVIVSYPLLRRDIARYVGPIWHTLILDEAQTFKNYATQTAQAVKALRAEFRFALTGTPIENSLDELRSIFDVILPGLYPGRKAFAELSREAVAKRARPFLLRRLKSDVLRELPEKIETLQVSELLPEQKKLYAAYLAKLRLETLKHLDDEDGFAKQRIRFLAGLTRLRQLCCHPALFVEGYKGGSAKFAQLLDTIEECRGAGRRLLVFSQFTEMLGIVSRELGVLGVPFFYLDGATPAAERVELCSRFNAGERELFLISLKAGGTGLNLTGADTVVLYDLWWNPAVERQAEDRAHRIGQKQVVQVIRLVAQGTVEEKMYALQQRKKSLIAEVIGSGEESLSALSEQDIRELLEME